MSDPAPDAADRATRQPLDRAPEPSPRLLVVDADDRTRESIVGILRIRHRYEVVGSAGHAGAALALIAEHRPDVVIIDPRLPELPDGIALIRRIRTIHPDACILAVGWTPSLEHDTLGAGADGFVRKTFKPGDLSEAIERCLEARMAAPRPGLIL
jgi:DNA-binding NarL/FixJ family response regulator